MKNLDDRKVHPKSQVVENYAEERIKQHENKCCKNKSREEYLNKKMKRWLIIADKISVKNLLSFFSEVYVWRNTESLFFCLQVLQSI